MWPVATAWEGVSQPVQESPGISASRSSVEAILPQPPAARLRQELDSRLKLSLRRSFQGSQRLVTLESLLVRYATAQEKRKSITAYWRTVKLIVTVDAFSHLLSELENFACPPDRRAYFEAIKGAATSRLNEIRGELVAAQAELAHWAGITESNTQVFPDDLPHTGGYRTHLASLFPEGKAPSELRKIDALLPLVRQSIYLHYSAMQSAHDAWLAYCEATNSGTPQVEAALAMWRLEADELAKCLEAIETYNTLILDYALAVGSTSISATQLLDMLLEPESRGVVSRVSSGAPKDGSERQVDPSSGTPAGQGATGRGNRLADQLRLWPGDIGSGTLQAFGYRVAKASTGSAGNNWAERGFFSELTTTRLETLIQELTELTAEEAQRWLPYEKVDLRNFLVNSGTQPSDWGQAAGEYWELVEAQVRLALAIKETSELGEIFAVALSRAGERGGAEAMLEIHAVRQAADAALQDAHLVLLEKQFGLGRQAEISRGTDLVATTVPFSGPYQTHWTHLASQADLKDRGRLARLAEQIPLMYAAIVQSASALLASDLARQQGFEAYRQDQLHLDRLIETVRLEFEIWREFLAAVRRYNCAIAEYAAGCLPNVTLSEYLKAIGYQASGRFGPAQ